MSRVFVPVEWLEELLSNVDVPDKNCGCHISPPCSDCVNYSFLREAVEGCQSAVKAATGSEN